MSSVKALTGDELVVRGITKIDSKLPERGIKEVRQNGSWLEQKQIESALEARKHLIAVERIEKRGNISHAEWMPDLMLAEVTQKVGGHWQYLGHNVGKNLYIKPEEILYLMESNCLQLKYNGVLVSLQQAYSLLLKIGISLLQYKVYASLSRLGYKVIRHNKPEVSSDSTKTEILVSDEPVEVNNIQDIVDKSLYEQHTNVIINEKSIDIDSIKKNDIIQSERNTTALHRADVYKGHKTKLLKLKNRNIKPCNNEILHKYFDNCTDFLDKGIVTMRAPDAKFIPENIKTKETYILNLQNIPKNFKRPFTYSSSDEANENNIKRTRNTSSSSSRSSTRQTYTPQYPMPSHNNQFRHPSYERPNPHYNFVDFQMLFQRPFLPSIYFASPFRNFATHSYGYGPSFCGLPTYPVTPGTAGQVRPNNKDFFLNRIKQLAFKLRQLLSKGNLNQENTQSLQRLLNTYNSKYKTNLKLGPCFEIITGGNIVETIELDDDTQPEIERPKLDNSFDDNLKSIKQVVYELGVLEKKGKATPKHRRSFSKLIKSFNKCYSVDYYLTTNFELQNRSHINLDSSSDSDCKIDDKINSKPKKGKKRKKLKNPFNILKRLSEKHGNAGHSSIDSDVIFAEERQTYSELSKNGFPINWLPKEDDFGRAEKIKTLHEDPLFDYRKTQLLFDCANIKPMCKNWIDLKIAFLESLDETISEFHREMSTVRNNVDDECLVKPEDCTNMSAVLQKLRIISCNYKGNSSCSLNIDFDVYNKDVQNFRKSNLPTPNFRIICLSEVSNLPFATDIATLHSLYKDNVPIVFALVNGNSISYLRVNPTEIPVYTSLAF